MVRNICYSLLPAVFLVTFIAISHGIFEISGPTETVSDYIALWIAPALTFANPVLYRIRAVPSRILIGVLIAAAWIPILFCIGIVTACIVTGDCL